MQKKVVKEMVMAGLFVTLGLVLPGVFHFFGLGKVFLPIHIPVLLAGFMLSLPYATAVGVLTPLLSSIITGMPPFFPVMPYMVFELASYAVVACFLSKKWKLNVYISLTGSMIAGRLAAAAVVWIMAVFLGIKLPGPVAFVIAAVTTGIPGIAVQIILIPPMVVLLRKAGIIRNEVIGIEQ